MKNGHTFVEKYEVMDGVPLFVSKEGITRFPPIS